MTYNSFPAPRTLSAWSETWRGADQRLHAIEAAVRWGWDAVIGIDGEFLGMHSFGESAPYKDLYKHFGITAEAAVSAALKRLGGKG